MTDDGNAPTLADSQGLTNPVARGVPRAPDTRYEMRALLGRGGMGEVWLAHDARVDREVAIKLMRGDATRDPQAAARFLREARVQGRLEHPAIVPVHDLGGGDAPYFAMKRLAGVTLADVLDAQAKGDGDAVARWPVRTLLARLVDVCLAIELAHRRGVIHRDLKPANIMLGDLGETYVLDWGLARLADADEPATAGAIRTTDLPADSNSGQTVAGAMLGTPGYMPPEQMRGERVDHRVDIYALGCILYEIVAGRPALPRENVLQATLSADCHRPSRVHSEIDLELDDACARATAAAASDRFASARELADAIQRYLDGDRDLARRRELAAEHARRATELFATGGDDVRAEVVRDAGRALALDPTNSDAPALLARLLFEPPREIPEEARATMRAEREKAGQAVLRVGTQVYLLFMLLVPMFWWLGHGVTWPFLVLLSLMLVGIAVTYLGSRRPRLIESPMYIVMVALHAAMLAMVGVVFGPLFILPPVLVGSLAALLMAPTSRRPWLVAAFMALALAVPFMLEFLRITPATFELSDGSITFHPWAIDLDVRSMVLGWIVTMAVQLFATTAIADHFRIASTRAQEDQHVRAWHLRQLLPK
jgi:serine/threonine protein kinase